MANTTKPRRRREGEGTRKLMQFNDLAERVIAMAVVGMLIVASGLILWESGVELWHGLTGDDTYSLTTVLSDILLALMIAEIIGTVSSFLRDGAFNPIPFLVVGIIASVRRLSVISAESTELLSSGAELPLFLIAELGVLAFTIAVCAWSISILQGKVDRRTRENRGPEAA